MSTKPFNLSCIKKITSDEMALTSAIFDLVPESRSGETLSIRIRKMLMRHLGEKSFFYLDNVASSNFSSFLSSLPEASIIALMNVEPINARLTAQIDNNLAFLLIDKLLGGTGEFSPENRPLSETEQGVLQYFMMQVLSEVWKSFGEDAKLHFRFDRFVTGAADLSKMSDLKDNTVTVSFKVGIGDLAGFVKITFTGGLIKKASGLSNAGQRQQDSLLMAERADRFGYVKTSLWAEAGRVTVSSGDLITLEAGDVLLFDESGLILKEGKPYGSVELKAGKGEEGSLTTQIQPDGRTLRCTVAGG